MNSKQVKSRNLKGVLTNDVGKTEGKSSNNMLLQNVNKTDKSNMVMNTNKQNRINEGIFATYNKSSLKDYTINKKNSTINKSNNENQSCNKTKLTSDYATNSKVNIIQNEYKNKIFKNCEFKTFSNILSKNMNKSNEKEYKNTINKAIDNLLFNSNKQK